MIKRTILINRSTKEIKETHKMRYLFMQEIAFFPDMAGFELLDCIDCNTLNMADNSWTAYFIARKR